MAPKTPPRTLHIDECGDLRVKAEKLFLRDGQLDPEEEQFLGCVEWVVLGAQEIDLNEKLSRMWTDFGCITDWGKRRQRELRQAKVRLALRLARKQDEPLALTTGSAAE